MKTCMGCVFAVWEVSQTGRLSPTGRGKCAFIVKVPVLPEAFAWSSVPSIQGGEIKRGRRFEKDCPTYLRAAR